MINEYVIDISKPPIPPPNRSIEDLGLFGEYETKESIKQTKKWCTYITAYSLAQECQIQKYKYRLLDESD